MTEQHPFSVWFVIGLLLIIYGLMIMGAGVYDYFVPPANPVVMNELHAPIWWGGLLLVMGLFYSIKFTPKKQKK
ncbi:MAG TPA: hypothetical protein VMM57_01415 [Bacteroidota bacterium]|nr:hypothetical protein [Bacteroidota bacterium]